MDTFTPKPIINTYFKTVYYFENKNDSKNNSKNDSKLSQLGLKRKREDALTTSNKHSQLSSHLTVYS